MITTLNMGKGGRERKKKGKEGGVGSRKGRREEGEKWGITASILWSSVGFVLFRQMLQAMNVYCYWVATDIPELVPVITISCLYAHTPTHSTAGEIVIYSLRSLI